MPQRISSQGPLDQSLLNNNALLNAALLSSLLQSQMFKPTQVNSNNLPNMGNNMTTAVQDIKPLQSAKREAPKVSRKRPQRSHSDSDAEDSLTDGAFSHSSDEADRHHKRVHHDPELMQGERRLTIQFDSYGTRGTIPQTFGRGSCIIPDGLCGRHTLYGESWCFTIKHESYDKESGLACVTWSMKSLASNQNLSRTETLAEARKRELHGRTIANQVVKKDTWRLHLKGKIDALRPARFTQGPLAFGLHHKAVQDRMKELMQTSEESVASLST
jgi:hypothetical protein